MAVTMTYDEWMKGTFSYVRPRSDSLKLLDKAIQARNEAEAKKALVNWIDEQNRKKQDWQRSVRNEKGTVKKLYDQLGILGMAVNYQNLDDMLDDKRAKDFIKQEQEAASSRLFTGKTVRFKDTFWGICRDKCRNERSKLDRFMTTGKNVGGTAIGVGANVLTTAKDFGSTASDLKTVITTILGTITSHSLQNQIIEIVFGSTVESFVASVAPFIGTASSGAKAIKAWISVALNIRALNQMQERRGDIRLGDPSAALMAIMTILDREIATQKAQGAIRTAAFTAKGLFTLADFGTASTAAIGALESLAIMLNTLADVVQDGQQIEAGNKLIQSNNIDLKIFSACPILGCYYIAIQDHSTIMNFDIENMGKENWRQEAERLKYAIKPVIKKAKELIAASRMELQGMEMAKGVYQKTLLQSIEVYYKSKGYGQSNNMESIRGMYQN